MIGNVEFAADKRLDKSLGPHLAYRLRVCVYVYLLPCVAKQHEESTQMSAHHMHWAFRQLRDNIAVNDPTYTTDTPKPHGNVEIIVKGQVNYSDETNLVYLTADNNTFTSFHTLVHFFINLTTGLQYFCYSVKYAHIQYKLIKWKTRFEWTVRQPIVYCECCVADCYIHFHASLQFSMIR